MKVKLIIGEYAYLYHGEIILDGIHKCIQQQTKQPYKIKWKDIDDEMISIIREQDLKYCLDATKQLQNSQVLRLFIYEVTGVQQSQFQKQKQIMQQSNFQFASAQSNLVTPKAVEPFFPNNHSNTVSQQTFGLLNQDSDNSFQQLGRLSTDIANFFGDEEKEKYCRQIVCRKMDEFYQDLSKKILKQNNQPLELIKQQSEQQQFQSQFPKIKKSNSIQETQQQMHYQSTFTKSSAESQNTPQLGPKFEKEPTTTEIFNDPKLLQLYSFADMKDSIATKKIDNQKEIIEEKYSNLSNQSDSNRSRNEEEEIYCDYCSEFISEVSTAYLCPECVDLHICNVCFEEYKEAVHFHKLIINQKQQ